MCKVTINGQPYLFEQGHTILHLLKQVGIAVPTLCHDERVRPAAVCRLCLVKIKGISRLRPACSTPLADQMEIETHLPEIEDYRKSILYMLAKDYPLAEVLKYPQKEFHRWLRHYDIIQQMEDSPCKGGVDTSHPYLQVDMSKCIKCFRCVNVCNDLQGQFVWHIANSSDATKLISDSKGLFAQSSCVSCGACSDSCPTGAIEDKHWITNGTPDQAVRSVCGYCGVGCEISVGIKEAKIAGIRPVMDAPVNKGHLCVKGRYAWEYVYASDRVTHPMIRKNDQWQIATWKEVIDYCAQKLLSILNSHGPDSIGMIGSARATNEDNYLVQKFARVVIGTNNVDNCARVCHQPTAKAMSMLLGTGASTNSFDDIENAKTILVAGANTTGSHPIIGARIKQAVLKGAKLVVIDPRKTELAKYATCFLQILPGTNIPLLNAMANVIIAEGLCDETFIRNRTEGFEEFKDFLNGWKPERAAKICHVNPRLIREAARLYAKHSPSICFHGLGLTEHTQGTENVMALVNLAVVTGNLGKPGSGINPLRGQNNVQGAAAMGCDPSVYTGMAPVQTDRLRFEALWKTSLPTGKGLNILQMLDAAVSDHLKALWITGYDVFFTMPDAKYTAQAFDRLNFLIVQDMFLTETASKFADVFLPVTSAFEKDGTFMNAERRIQKLRKAIAPAPGTRPDWEIVCSIASAMGKNTLFNFSSAEEIWNEVRNAWPAVYGITYDRLEHEGIQWPCPDTSHPGTKILHTTNFPRVNSKAKLGIVEFKPTIEQANPNYPFVLVTGRELYHFNAGTMTYRTANAHIRNADLLHLHPKDAKKLGLKDGDNARVKSQYGQTTLRVCIDSSMCKGNAFSTFSNRLEFVNKVTSPLRDNHVQTPEYKITAVQIEKA